MKSNIADLLMRSLKELRSWSVGPRDKYLQEDLQHALFPPRAPEQKAPPTNVYRCTSTDFAPVDTHPDPEKILDDAGFFGIYLPRDATPIYREPGANGMCWIYEDGMLYPSAYHA